MKLEEVKYSSTSSSSSSMQSSMSSQIKPMGSNTFRFDDIDANFMDLAPPNFLLAEIHGNANRVKDLDRYQSKQDKTSRQNPNLY